MKLLLREEKEEGSDGGDRETESLNIKFNQAVAPFETAMADEKE